MAQPSTLTIGQLASAAGVGVETIRFYQRKGLIREPPRRDAGYRRYPSDSVRRIQFIRRAKALGFTLREVGELLSLRVEANTSCDEVRVLAMAKMDDIDHRLAELTRMRAALSRLVQSCRGAGPTGGCPILDALEAEEDNDVES